MTALARITPEVLRASTASCAHCNAPAHGARFCCAGCEAAHELVAGLGLDAFYHRRTTEAGQLRPDRLAPADVSAHAVVDGDGHRLSLMLSGLTCGACVWLVENALLREADITHARANLAARRLDIAWRGPAARGNDFAAVLARLGFRAAPWSAACLSAAEDAEGRALTRAFGIAAFGSMNVMLASVAVWAGTDMGEATRGFLHWLAALVALPVVAYAGMPFYRSAFCALRAGRLNMDMAVSLGVLATTAMSLSEALRNGPFTWFDGATALLALLLGGRVLDRAARRRARQSVAELLALQGGGVTRLDGTGGAAACAVDAVRAGDRLLVATGERLRLDGRAASATLLDTAATTGEALPRGFAAGVALPAGAVNLGAPFVLAVTAAAKDGSIAAMARLLEQGAAARGRYVSLADRAARIYVPVAHAVAFGTFLGWWLLAGVTWQEALVPAVAALIITCPCGLAIAVPAVQVVAVGALFRRGVLVTSPTALERLASADRVVLDKTGTLTLGQPELLGAHEPALLRRAAMLAHASRHPLARALLRACPDAPAATDAVEEPGQGVRAGDARIGNAAFCGARDDGQGMTLWFRADAGAAPVALRFADRLRDDADHAVAALGALGLRAELLSGDGARSVADAARAAGIGEWRAGVSPAEKAARMDALAAAGARPLMVGDGLNDAAALSRAHVSASMGDGTDLAQAAADIVLQGRAPLAALPGAVVAARRAQQIARQNIAMSLAYNLVAVPCAVLGLATPLIAAVVMATSSIAVILNALRAEAAP